jgi:predicted NodU family carbamoyl transferase
MAVTVLGITLGHDSGFALIEDGRVMAVMEAERYFRQKRYKLHALSLQPGPRPSGYQQVNVDELRQFLAFVADAWGTRFDAVAVQNQGRLEEYRNLLTLLGETGIRVAESYHVNHHLSHAALAFYTSPFEEAVVLSYDGEGNDGQTVVFRAAGPTGLRYVEKNPIRFGHSYNNAGFICGIKPDISGTTAGKLMGLVAYGHRRSDWMPYARRYVREYRKLVPQTLDGVQPYGQGHRINPVALAEIPELQPFQVHEHADSLWERARRLLRDCPPPALRLPGPEHKTTQDLAATVQAAWTAEVLTLLEPHRSTSRNLCVTGGCALNGIANFEIQERGLFANTHFVPNPSDCGLSVGAALWVAHHRSGRPYQGYDGHFTPHLGPEAFDRDQLPVFRQKYPHRDLPPGAVTARLARLVQADRIVGVIRGRYEVGPRALGNRSILCNPLNRQMREIINRQVKHREWYRPFAPVVTAEDAHRYFTNTRDIPYMSVICYTRPEWADRLPAVTHADGSARVQTVTRAQNAFLYDTLKAFEALSGVPIMLNTSFNPRGEPILNFCAVGLEMLDTTDLDLVLIDDTLFSRVGKEHLLDLP